MTENRLVTVYEVPDAFEAEIIKNALTAEGIPCVLGGEEQASVAAIPGTTVQILVPEGDALRAREFLKSHERTAPPEGDA